MSETAIKDWTPEEYENILARARDEYEEEAKNGRWPDADSIGLYAYAHLMRPKDFEPAIILAEILCRQQRHLEAVKLCEFAFNNYDGPHSRDLLGWKRFANTYAMLATSYMSLEIYDKAMIFAKAADRKGLVNHIEIKGAIRTFEGGFPDGPLKRELELLGCKFYAESTMAVSTELTENTWVFWLRDEEQLNDLTPEKLGYLCCYTKAIVCTSSHLQRLFEARLPFYGTTNVHVIREAPISDRPKDPPTPKENLVVFVGSKTDFAYFEESFATVKNAKLWYEGPCGVSSSFWPAGAYYVFCGPSANRYDVERLIHVQSAGVTCLVSAVGPLSEYLMSGRLFKPPYCSAHIGAMAKSAVTLVSSKKAREAQEPDWIANVHKAFSAKAAARQWLQTLRPYL